jgi:serine/threonine protein kinase
MDWGGVSAQPWRTPGALGPDGCGALGRCLAAFRAWGSVVPPHHLRVVRPVGSGGCATVFLARMASPPSAAASPWRVEDVALKRLEVPPNCPAAALARSLDDFHAEAAMLHALQRAYRTEVDSGGVGGDAAAAASVSGGQVGSGGTVFHPCIAAMLGTVEVPLSLVVEFCRGGNLMEALGAGGHGTFPWPLKRSVAADVASGCSFLHRQHPPVLHRDLKSLNILLDHRGRAKVSDFGLSRRSSSGKDSHLTTMVGTYHWMAPEVMNAAGPASPLAGPTAAASPPGGGGPGGGGPGGAVAYGTPVDVYSFAIVCWELATCAVPYDGWAAPQVIVAVAHRGDRLPLPPPRAEAGDGEGEGGGLCPGAFLRLVEDCWAHDPASRPPFAKIEAALGAMPHA